jgi:voltage-gated potassium channel
VHDKKRYLLSNWMNLVIILAGVPLEWKYTPLIGVLRNLRLLLMMFLLMRLSHRIRSYLARGHLSIMMLITGIIIVLSGIIISRLDPSIGTIWDGMWYSWVTISHTGYGDIVPKTAAARFFGGILILLGVVLATVFTANLSVFLIGSRTEKNDQKEKKEEAKSDENLQEIMKRLDHIERMLDEQKR